MQVAEPDPSPTTDPRAVGGPASDRGPTDSKELVCSPPVVMAPRSDGFEIRWSVTAAARGWVELADPAAPDQIRMINSDRYGFVPQGTEVLRIRVDGLDPGTDHLVRTITEATTDDRRHVSAWKQVRTLAAGANTTSIVVWNDTHNHDETIAALDDATPKADVWVWNGDVCNDWKDAAALAPTVLSPAGRDVTDGRPMMFVRGNHDVRGPWAYRLREVVATPDDRPYYAFRSGPVAVIMLDTGEDKPDDHPSFAGRPAFAELRQRQADWLAEQIRQPGFVDAPYRVVFCHLPLRWIEELDLTDADYADGKWDAYSRVSRDLWHDSLEQWGTQLVVSGHTHRSTHIPAEPGFGYVQVTGGGPHIDVATWIGLDADDHRLAVTVNQLDGTVVHHDEFEPRRRNDRPT